jgi:hypothetical protein
MKAIILSAATAIVAVAGFAAPAGALGIAGAGSTATSTNGWVSMGVGPNGPYFMGQSTMCYSSANVFDIGFGNVPAVDQSTVEQTPNNNCTTQTGTPTPVSNPPQNATVTINGVCGDPAELAKISAEHSNLIINSVGPCPTDMTSTPAPQPVTVTVTTNAPEPKATTASATPDTTTDTPAAVSALPTTGSESAVVAGIASILGGTTYAGLMVIRALRGRA